MDSIAFSDSQILRLTNLALLICKGRAEIKFEKDGKAFKAIEVAASEAAFKVIDYLKNLARGHALIFGRTAITDEDLKLLEEVAISCIPRHLRRLVRALREGRLVNTKTIVNGLGSVESDARLSSPTARSHMDQLAILGIVELTKGSPQTNEPDSIALSKPFQWLLLRP